MTCMKIERMSMETITGIQFQEMVDLELNCGLKPFPPEVLAANIECEETWAAMDGDHVAGFITVSSEEGYFNDDLFIFNINVGSAWRRRGIATALIRNAIARHPECRTMSLDVALTNAKAMSLYEKLGFRRTDTPSMNGPTDIVMKGDRPVLLALEEENTPYPQ